MVACEEKREMGKEEITLWERVRASEFSKASLLNHEV
jgi:hypothetical protein